jgi:DNA-binding CsgD family transcriptional regulator
MENFPEITASNLRIILLQKLGFSNADISGLLGITVEAVKKSKQRLKRKLGDKYDLLFQLIAVEN